MHTKRFGRYPRHRKLPLRAQLQFLGLSLLSLVAIFLLALLSRAELRLSGDTFAADGRELSIMDQLRPFESTELVRETPNLRLYVLKRGQEQYLVEVKKSAGGEWEITSVEKLHR